MASPEQDALLAVQDLDVLIDQHKHRRAHLPERAAIAANDSEAASVKAGTKSVVATRDEIAKRQTASEVELASTEERMTSVSRRLYGGEVSASRELQAMANDVESLKRRASALEDDVLALLEEREPLDKQIAAAAAKVAEMLQRRAALVEALGDAEVGIDVEIAELVDRRADTAAGVPADLMSTYERLRAELGGVGAARLVGNHCDGCHLTLSAVELDHVRHLPAGEVATCEQCSRILIP